MKDGLLFGVAMGMIAGAYLAKNNEDVSKLIDKGQSKLKKEMDKLKCNCQSSGDSSK